MCVKRERSGTMILVTGAAGHVGRAVFRRLASSAATLSEEASAIPTSCRDSTSYRDPERRLAVCSVPSTILSLASRAAALPNRQLGIYHTPSVMHHALSLSIIRGRGDMVTRFILLLSADADAMQLRKPGLRHFGIQESPSDCPSRSSALSISIKTAYPPFCGSRSFSGWTRRRHTSS
jgi:hypothetical protein